MGDDHKMEMVGPLLVLAYDTLMPVVMVLAKVSSPWPRTRPHLEVELEGLDELNETALSLELNR